MEKTSKRSKKRIVARRSNVPDLSIFHMIAKRYAQDTLSVDPTSVQVGQEVYDSTDTPYIVIEDEADTTNKVLMPADQVSVGGVPQDVNTVEDIELQSEYTVQPSTGVGTVARRKRSMETDKVWWKFEQLQEILGTEGLLMELAKGIGMESLEFQVEETIRVYDLSEEIKDEDYEPFVPVERNGSTLPEFKK